MMNLMADENLKAECDRQAAQTRGYQKVGSRKLAELRLRDTFMEHLARIELMMMALRAVQSS
jgi:hypothetical protein